MLKKYTRGQKIVAISLLFIISIITSIILIKPYFFYKQPFKLFGYVAYNTTMNENYAYTTTNKGFYVSEIGEEGRIITNYLSKSNSVCFGIYLIGEELFVGYENGNLVRYDVSNPRDIIEISSISLEGAILGISSKEDTLYISTAKGNIYSIDLTEDTVLDSYSVNSEYLRDIEIYNDYLLYASTNTGVGILDITNPENLLFVKRISSTKPSFDINIFDNKLFISRHEYGLIVFEISNEINFSPIKEIDNYGEIYSSAFDGEYLILGDLKDGIEKWKYNSEKNTFVYIATFEKSVPHHLYIFDNQIYTADQDRGLFISQIEDIN